MKVINQAFSVPFQYQVFFTNYLFQGDNPLLKNLLLKFSEVKSIRAYVVIDDGVILHHPDLVEQIRNYFKPLSHKVSLCDEVLKVPGGELAKNDNKYLQKILEATSKFGIDRHSLIIGIGGGAVLDMVGFAAAISHRGIKHIRIPTTVLSQNDSGVGVKNGVNAFNKKNYLGSFAPPAAVINDFQFLTTLNERDWRSGISEAIKVALIKDKTFFDAIAKDAKALARREMKPMEELIYRCAQMHLDHIAGGDPFEMGSSRPLDFGHWSAHKLEQLTNFEVRHGEAVAIGIALDVTYSYLQNRINKSDWEQVIQLIKDLGFELYHPGLSQKDEQGNLQVLNGLNEFREHLGGELTIMLLEELGKGIEVHEMDNDLIIQSITLLEKFQEVDIEK
ncbi:3-dehydroquinate synthase [Flexithrix dorotheae]|uniref:3-dehydroquinate synthase n=1 Tax=Flexithrix dorotheae TaxID=70993 RepID=UPI00038082D7|nr:3-dehydroquinate synthase [Flexithrix dorotheae]